MSRKSPAEYEKFIGDLVADLSPRYTITSIGWGPKNKLRGHSGVSHQVDVSFIDGSTNEPKLVLIECKSLRTGRSVNLGQVKILKATLDDLEGCPEYPSTVRTLMISSAPLQAGARTYANHYGILSQVVSDGPNWAFRYEQMLQLGLELRGGGAVIQGIATVQRRCRACEKMFLPMGSELLCPSCGSKSVA